MAIASNNSIIKTVEVNKNISDIAKKVFKSYQLKNINIDTSSFKDFFKKTNNENLDLVYIDGTYDKKSTIENFNSLLKYAHNESVFIFNNIYWSKEMTEAWNIIKKQKEITVSIDTYYLGFLFFRKEQPKQHFTIRL
jgi:predicted O-methyltransferase YrrM